MKMIILHATDLAENHFRMCERAVELAQKFKAKLYLLHVIETPPSLVLAQGLGFTEIENPEPLTQDAHSVLSVLGNTFAIPKKQLFVEVGSARTHILQKANDLGCHLIIIGHHSNKNSLVMGNTTRTVIDKATCDVLTLKE